MFLESVRVADGASEVTLQAATNFNSPCRPAVLHPTTGVVAIACTQASIMTLDGTILTSVPETADVLGLDTRGAGIVTVDFAGAVMYSTATADPVQLATSPFTFAQLVGPFAAYAP